MNKIVVIGWMGCKTCYLNVDRSEAIRRYMIEHEVDEVDDSLIEEFEFGDEFGVYDAWR